MLSEACLGDIRSFPSKALLRRHAPPRLDNFTLLLEVIFKLKHLIQLYAVRFDSVVFLQSI